MKFLSFFSKNKKETEQRKITIQNIIRLNELKSYIVIYYKEVLYSSIHTLGVTYLNCNETDDLITFTIKLEFPGRLIGKAGENLDKLTDFLSKSCEKKVEIKIEESQLWVVFDELLPTYS